MSNKKKVFDADYILRFVLICVIAIGIIFLAWTFKFRSNVIVSLNESNNKMFDDKFMELADASKYSSMNMMNISSMGQKKIVLEFIDRGAYDLDTMIFGALPAPPEDWGKTKFSYDSGRYYILKDLSDSYYLQPEFYDDWFGPGMEYFKKSVGPCKNGFFASPSSQRIYTNAGSTIDTYVIFRASFCAGRRQAFSPISFYPSKGSSDDGIEFTQDPLMVEKYIKISFSPKGFVLGRVFPMFDIDWAQKASIRIDVDKDTPRGLYIVSVVADSNKPLVFADNSIDYDAYKSKDGTSLMNFIIAVD